MSDTPYPKLFETLLDYFDATRVYAWLGGLSLILLVFLTPPFQVPDEPQHFYRSYQLSELRVWRPDGEVHSALPASLPELVQHFMGTTKFHAHRAVPKQRLVDTLAELHRPLDAKRTVLLDLSGIQSYAPLPYIPQALAIAAGRTLGVGPLGLLYMGRMANALVAGVVTAIAIALFPIGRTVALLVALLPMTQFLMASVSPDALTIASALLFTSIMARFLVDGEWPMARQVTAFASGLVMCIVKVVHLPLLFVGLGAMLGARRFSDTKTRRNIYMQLAAAAATIMLIGLWFWSIPATNSPSPPVREGVNGAAQIAYLADDIFRALRIVIRSVYVSAEFLSKSTVGILGWLNIPLSIWVYLMLSLALPLSICEQPRAGGIGKVHAVWLLLVAVAVIPPIELALYIGWTPVGAYGAEGVQGRYFIPALSMFGLGVAALVGQHVRPLFARLSYFCVVVILFATTAAMHLTVIREFGLF